MSATESVTSFAAASGRVEPAFAMSVDVEEYFQVQAFARRVNRTEWERWPSRVEADVERLLGVFAEARGRATFFILGWVAKRHPAMVRRIAACGHEVASHGNSHRMITELTPAEMRQEASDSRSLLEDLSGTRVEGYRAPSYTIGASTRWALDILVETGYRYDSSVFPIRGRRYGYPEGPVVPTRLATSAGEIAEFPLSTLSVGPLRLPVLAGSYLRLLPAWISVAAAHDHVRRNIPLVVNVHTWETDPEQPTVGPSRRAAWTHYARIGSTVNTLKRVMRVTGFASIGSRLRELGLLEPAPG